MTIFRKEAGENVDGKTVCRRPRISLELETSLPGHLIYISAVMRLPLSYYP